MTIKLEEFRYLARGPQGWHSELPPFGELLTAVQGENGSGKTPIMKGIVWTLGHKLQLTPEVIANCSAAELQLTVEGRLVTLTRPIGLPQFALTVNDAGDVSEFDNEGEYAKWFLSLFGSAARTLTNKQKKATDLYANTLIPGFWVDQDHGWTQDYWAPSNFIEDQREEVIRFLVGMPARHPFSPRDKYDEAKADLAKTETAIQMQRFVLDKLEQNGKLRADDVSAIQARRIVLQADLAANNAAVEAVRSVTSQFELDLSRLEAERQSLQQQAAQLQRNRGQLVLVMAEVEGEVEILTGNAQAAAFFRQLCSREECQMFSSPAESYGRTLLFLKDQIKDLQVSHDELSHDVAELEARLRVVEGQLSAKRLDRQKALGESPHAQVAAKLDVLAKDLVDTELKVAQHEQYSVENQKFARLLDKREQLLATVEELKPTGSRSGSSGDARQHLTESLQDWLGTLSTPNVKQAWFDNEFNIMLDGRKFGPNSSDSGSTRARIVLAFHAALLETGVRLGGNHPGWLLLDAPKQHELNQKDFDAYVAKLRRVAATNPGQVQLVFSVADLRTQLEVGDERWFPPFTFPEADPPERFLGTKAPEPRKS